MKNQKWSFDRNKNSNNKFNSNDKYAEQKLSRRNDYERQSIEANKKKIDILKKDKNLLKQYRKADEESDGEYYDKNKHESSRSRISSSDRFRNSHRSKYNEYKQEKYTNHHFNKKSRHDYDSDYSDTNMSITSKGRCSSSYREYSYNKDYDANNDCFENTGNINDKTANYKNDVHIYKNEKNKDSDSDLESGEIE